MSKSGYASGAGRAAPFAAAAALLGLLSLAGQPLTAGFPWRWTLLDQISASSGTGVLLMVVSMLAILWAVLKWTSVLFASVPAEEEIERLAAGKVAVAILAGACLLWGIFPQLALPWVSQATAGLANLSP
jgi:formate hydrogenlyase subunit 3/multisubunit Na+/H+ antiporter MnhD subunit